MFLTGHTGFKGGWMALWLQRMGAQVTGFALPPETQPALYNLANIGSACTSIFGDLRELGAVHAAITAAQPEIVLHLAAQPIVKRAISRVQRDELLRAQIDQFGRGDQQPGFAFARGILATTRTAYRLPLPGAVLAPLRGLAMHDDTTCPRTALHGIHQTQIARRSACQCVEGLAGQPFFRCIRHIGGLDEGAMPQASEPAPSQRRDGTKPRCTKTGIRHQNRTHARRQDRLIVL